MYLCPSCSSEHIRFTQTVPLSSSLIGIAVSILSEEEKTYITGFELVHADRESPNIIFGHRLPIRQVIMDVQRQPLRGFVVVTGEGGIHAIRPVFKTDSHWMGRPDEDACKSVRLVSSEDIKALLRDFDVRVFHSNGKLLHKAENSMQHCKMIRLAMRTAGESAKGN